MIRGDPVVEVPSSIEPGLKGVDRRSRYYVWSEAIPWVHLPYRKQVPYNRCPVSGVCRAKRQKNEQKFRVLTKKRMQMNNLVQFQNKDCLNVPFSPSHTQEGTG